MQPFKHYCDKLNRSKWTIICFIILLVIAFSFYFRGSENALSKADDLFKENKFKQAIISYKQLLITGSLNVDEIKKVKMNIATSLFKIADQALKEDNKTRVISSCLELIKNFEHDKYLTSCKTKINIAFLNLTQPLLDDKKYADVLDLIRQAERYLGSKSANIWQPKLKDIKIESLFSIAMNHLKQKQYYLGISHLKSILAINPNPSWKAKVNNQLELALFKDGVQEEQNKAYDNALKSFQNLVKQFPESTFVKQVKKRIERLYKLTNRSEKKEQAKKSEKKPEKKSEKKPEEEAPKND